MSVDKCPTVRGDAAHEGCSSQVSIEQDQIKISQRVEFALGSADLLPASDSILTAVQSVLDTNPDIKINVQGDTDSRGPTDNNLQLSESGARCRSGTGSPTTLRIWLRRIQADHL